MVFHGFPLTCFPALPRDLQHHQQDHGPKECADAGNTGANQQTQLPEQLDLVWENVTRNATSKVVEMGKIPTKNGGFSDF